MSARAKRTFASLAALLAVGVACFALVRSRAHASEPPTDLIKLGHMIGTSAKAVNEELEWSSYDWDTLGRTVVVKRRERRTVTDEWSEQAQKTSTPYFVTDVRWVCGSGGEIAKLFVAGVYPDGAACIEAWEFAYEPPPIPYCPIDRRPLPALERTELYRGQEYGLIRSLEADPAGRFVLFLTYEDPTLFRITLPSGSPQVELTQARVPYLIHAKQIVLRQHVREGRQYMLIQDPRWHADLRGFRRTIVLRDGDDDGIFDPPVFLSPAEWTALGYEDHEAWTSVCP